MGKFYVRAAVIGPQAGQVLIDDVALYPDQARKLAALLLDQAATAESTAK